MKRRRFIGGLAGIFAAPALVRAASLEFVPRALKPIWMPGPVVVTGVHPKALWPGLHDFMLAEINHQSAWVRVNTAPW